VSTSTEPASIALFCLRSATLTSVSNAFLHALLITHLLTNSCLVVWPGRYGGNVPRVSFCCYNIWNLCSIDVRCYQFNFNFII